MTTEAKNHLAAEGYDPQFGARPLKRVIQQRIENPIATRILIGQFQPDDTIVVGYEVCNFTFEARRDANRERVRARHDRRRKRAGCARTQRARRAEDAGRGQLALSGGVVG